jgi:hypothetical protein
VAGMPLHHPKGTNQAQAQIGRVKVERVAPWRAVARRRPLNALAEQMRLCRLTFLLCARLQTPNETKSRRAKA